MTALFLNIYKMDKSFKMQTYNEGDRKLNCIIIKIIIITLLQSPLNPAQSPLNPDQSPLNLAGENMFTATGIADPNIS